MANIICPGGFTDTNPEMGKSYYNIHTFVNMHRKLSCQSVGAKGLLDPSRDEMEEMRENRALCQ